MDRLDRPDDAFRWLCEIYSAHRDPTFKLHLTKLAQVWTGRCCCRHALGESMQEVMQNDSVTLSILGYSQATQYLLKFELA